MAERLIAIIAAFSTVLTIYLFEKMDFQSVLVYDICFTLLMSILYFIELYLEYYFDNVFRVRSFKRVKFLHFDRFRKSLIPGVISLITLTAFTLSTGLERFFELFNEFAILFIILIGVFFLLYDYLYGLIFDADKMLTYEKVKPLPVVPDIKLRYNNICPVCRKRSEIKKPGKYRCKKCFSRFKIKPDKSIELLYDSRKSKGFFRFRRGRYW